MAKLTTKQRAFILEYANCNFNGTEAAARAGYKGDRATLSVVASENLAKPKIREAIDQLLKDRAMSADEVLKALSDQARSAHAEYFVMKPLEDKEGNVIGTYPAFDFERCVADGNQHLIKEIRYKDSGVVEYRFHDAQGALFKLGQVHGLFTEKHELTISMPVAITFEPPAMPPKEPNDDGSNAD